MVAHLIDDAQRCQMCGSAAWEWDEDRFAYHAALRMCFGCQHLDAAKEDHKPSPGMRMVLVPRTD